MKIKSVVIEGKLPDSCWGCDFKEYVPPPDDWEWQGECFIPNIRCYFNHKDVTAFEKKRPPECPLTIECKKQYPYREPDPREVKRILKEFKDRYEK